MSVAGTVTMSLGDYEHLMKRLRKKEELIEELEGAFNNQHDGKEVVVTIVKNMGLFAHEETLVINPSDHVVELKNIIDRLNEENSRLKQAIADSNNTKVSKKRFWDF